MWSNFLLCWLRSRSFLLGNWFAIGSFLNFFLRSHERWYSLWFNFFLLNFFFFNYRIRKMRPVNFSIFNRDTLTTSNQVEIFLNSCNQVNVVNWYIYLSNFGILTIINLFFKGEKSDEPAIDVSRKIIFTGMGIYSFMIDIIPELEVNISFVGFS